MGRYPAKWRKVSTTCIVPGMSQRLALVLIGNGMQTEFGSIEAEVSTEAAKNDASSAGRGSLQHWCSTAIERASSADAFAPQLLVQDLVEKATKASVVRGVTAMAAEDAMADAAKEVSLASLKSEEERQLALALSESSRNSITTTTVSQVEQEEERLLARALEESRLECQRGQGLVFPSNCKDPDLTVVLGESQLSSVFNSTCKDPELTTALSESLRSRAVTDNCEDPELAAVLAESRRAQEQADQAALSAALRLSSAPSAMVSQSVLGLAAPVVVDCASDSDGMDVEVLAAQPLVGAAAAPSYTSTPERKRPKIVADAEQTGV